MKGNCSGRLTLSFLLKDQDTLTFIKVNQYNVYLISGYCCYTKNGLQYLITEKNLFIHASLMNVKQLSDFNEQTMCGLTKSSSAAYCNVWGPYFRRLS